MQIPLTAFLMVAALLFCIGIYTVLARRNAVAVLMGVELMLNAVNLNLVAFWRYLTPATSAATGPQVAISGQAFTAFVFVVAAAEVSVGLALVISMYRNRNTVEAQNANLLNDKA